ncbi:MAG: hypothetical protein ACRYE9_00630 [Janthinobacterium lividum]
MRTQLNIINNELTKTFQQTAEFLTFIGHQISKGNYQDSKFILNTLQDVNLDIRDIDISAFSWSFIDWVSPEGFQLLNQKKGIHNPPVDMNSRAYTKLCRSTTCKLHLSSPTVGFPSSILVIPAGMGITNENQEFIGSLVIGFNVEELNKILTKKVNKDVSFLVFDERDTVSFFSKNLDLRSHENLLADAKYQTSLKIPNTPYSIIVAYDQLVITSTLLEYLAIITLINLIVSLVTWISIKYTRKKTISINKLSESATRKLKHNIDENIISKATKITKAGSSLLSSIIDNYQLDGDTDEKIRDLLSVIGSESNLTNPLPEQINYENINLNQVIKESLEIKAGYILNKEVETMLNLQDDLPDIYTDRLCSKLIIVGFLSYAIDGLAHGGRVEVSSSLKVLADDRFLSINIKDSGLGIDPSDMERINSKFNGNISHFNSSIKYLFQLVEAMNCKCNLNPVLGVGTETNLLFPIKIKNHTEDLPSNIIKFKPR